MSAIDSLTGLNASSQASGDAFSEITSAMGNARPRMTRILQYSAVTTACRASLKKTKLRCQELSFQNVV